MSSEPERGGTQGVVSALRRWLWMVILCGLVGAGVAFALTRGKPTSYSATASLLFQQNNVSQQLFGFATSTPVDPTAQAATNITLVSQPTVASRAAQILHVPVATVAGGISIAAAGASDIVNVTASAASPSFAARLANAYALSFISYRKQADRSQIVQAAAQLQGQIRRLQQSGQAGGGQLRDLQTRLSQLDVLASTQTGDVQLGQDAGVPTAPVASHMARNTGLGLVAGVLVGLLAALILERLDHSLRHPEEARHLLGLPMLGVIPSSRALSRSRAAGHQGATVEGETFGLLRAQLRYFNVDTDIKSILVSSAAPGDGKSTVAWNLACAAADSPRAQVLLVDADLRRPVVAATAGVPVSPGLSELLTQGLSIDDVIHTLSGAGADTAGRLDVLTSGAPPPNPAELLESRKLQDLLEALDARYDFVIIDAPPTSVVSDAIPLMAQVSGLVIVVRVGRTRRDALRRLRYQLDELGAHVLGFVANDVSSRKSGYKGYYGTYARPAAVGDSSDVPTAITASQE
jgi:succinoglycan biosynthesis transport protein ExoP